MTSRDFAHWLQGFFEMSGGTAMTAEQGEMVKKHLSLVFKHEIDPAAGGPEQQAALNAIHEKPQLGGYDPATGMIIRC